ncbi:penicillin acylase family protein [Arcicella rosea]|uniref:Acyl-homoserine lactone acylase PvdQ n=1 Tax=Arcicella rosea TaxID=502909 RepID=A0A841EWB9_9BACT|nr:penicillin acylase family protein [Arcicella rosea]MBB6005373.1 acyl-homoserine lactone acylase PvdQ [Arcicella rosea]
MKKVILLLFLPFSIFAQKFSTLEISRFKQQAQRVNIIRDNWGIPHIYGKSDADAVFGLLYAQCEDDFKRVEMNYIEKLGRISELKGESELYNDLQIRLLIDTTEAKADYQKAAPWLKKLLNAYADGINYYLHTHPAVKPAILTRFQPWYPLLWTDGSIGAISTADLSIADLKNFYSGSLVSAVAVPKLSDHQTGSNGFAFSPKITASGNAILYINPHVTFYFRPEVQVISEEGLNAYGAVTWGQMFVYQGFNPYCGWMHTSSNVDVADVYAEKIIKKGEKYFYEYEGVLKPVSEKKITISYQSGNELKQKTFTTYFTHHGPIMAKRDDKWLSLKSYNRSVVSLIQSWKRTKAKGFEDYKQVMALKANTSNNTVFADNKGNIAYWHGNYIPKRDNQYNWAKPVDGSIAATEWKGLHAVDETVHLYNPVNGWLQNCNSTPFSVAGVNSPKRENYPSYMAPDGENFRGVNAVRVLDREKKYTIDKVIEAGYDTYLSAFEVLIPALVKTYERDVKPSDSLYNQLKAPIEVLKKWDYYSSENSVATTLAVEWAQKLNPVIQRLYIDQGETDQVENTKRFAANATVAQLMPALITVINDLTKKFGTWEIAWGKINRFQRLNGDLQAKYNDNEPSVPVGFASALWGSLPSYNSRYYQGTNKRYGVGGNSFICAVEFGKKIKAKSLLAGGESGDPSSKHFNDQLLMYTKGKFKDVLFYKEDVLKNAEKKYHPGE